MESVAVGLMADGMCDDVAVNTWPMELSAIKRGHGNLLTMEAMAVKPWRMEACDKA
jgi:hypothetical protein